MSAPRNSMRARVDGSVAASACRSPDPDTVTAPSAPNAKSSLRVTTDHASTAVTPPSVPSQGPTPTIEYPSSSTTMSFNEEGASNSPAVTSSSSSCQAPWRTCPGLRGGHQDPCIGAARLGVGGFEHPAGAEHHDARHHAEHGNGRQQLDERESGLGARRRTVHALVSTTGDGALNFVRHGLVLEDSTAAGGGVDGPSCRRAAPAHTGVLRVPLLHPCPAGTFMSRDLRPVWPQRRM